MGIADVCVPGVGARERRRPGMESQMSSYRRVFQVFVVLACVACCRLAACPFCLAPPQTFSQQFLLADVVVIAELLRFEVLNEGTQPRSTLRIREILSGEHDVIRRCDLKPGMSVVISAEAAGSPGSLFLMYGDLHDPEQTPLRQTFVDAGAESGAAANGELRSEGANGVPIRLGSFRGDRVIRKVALRIPDRIDWTEQLAISGLAAEYLRRMPSSALPQAQRLEYYAEHLESVDAEVAGDAWAEFGGSPYEDVKANRRLYHPERLRQWIADPLMSPERLGLYGLMLGLSGSVADAEFLETQMMDEKTGDFRFGAEGLLAGFLLLRGESGLDGVESAFLSERGSDKSRHALAMTLDFFVSYEPGVISKGRASRVMRQLASDAVLCQTAVSSLARWEDWASLPELERIFGEELARREVSPGEGLDESGLRAILEFAKHCERSGVVANGGAAGGSAEFASRAGEFLKRVETTAPALLKPQATEFRAPE